VTHALVRDLPNATTFYAEKGGGATRNGKPIATRAFREREELFSVYLGTMAEPQSFEVARSARRVRSLGSASLDLCGVASGWFDLYYMRSASEARLRVMDIAAGALLVREAGGVVVDTDGKDLDMPFTLKARTNLVAAGDARALAAIP
jgi:fructose-1,6-bisphosphatase/inositol monophosphatase family enzyme